MIKQSTRGANKNDTPLSEPAFFSARALSAHDGGTDHVVEKLEEPLQLNLDLHSEFSRWREDYGHGTRLLSVDFFDV
jgi:hypothetical protein